MFLLTNSSDLEVPDFKGLSKSEIMIISNLLGIKVKIIGEGYVYEQNISPGTKLEKSKVIELKLTDKIKK